EIRQPFADEHDPIEDRRGEGVIVAIDSRPGRRLPEHPREIGARRAACACPEKDEVEAGRMQQRAAGTVADAPRDPGDETQRTQRAALALREPGLAHGAAFSDTVSTPSAIRPAMPTHANAMSPSARRSSSMRIAMPGSSGE